MDQQPQEPSEPAPTDDQTTPKPKRNSGRGGRPPGALNVKTRKIAEQALAEGITPLEVMLKAMRRVVKSKGVVAAFPYAKDCAPYLHARIATVEHKSPGSETVNVDVAFGLPPEVARVLEAIVSGPQAGSPPPALPD